MKKFTEDDLIKLLNNQLPPAEKAVLMTQLKSDPSLRNQLKTHFIFKEMFRQVPTTPTEEETPGTHPSPETLAAFLTDNLSQPERNAVQEHLQKCPACAANLMRVNTALDTEESLPLPATPPDLLDLALEQKSVAVNWAGKLKQFMVTLNQIIVETPRRKMKSWFTPFRPWKVVLPVTVVALILVFILFKLPSSSPLQNDPLRSELIIKSGPSGPLGFVGQRTVMKYEGMHVSLSRDHQHLIFKWPAVPNTQFYDVNFILEDERQRLTPLTGIRETRFRYPIANIQLKKQYIWEISGKLADGRTFHARAAFVLSKFIQGE